MSGEVAAGRSDIGIIGLAVMGQNLALNMAGKGFRVSVFNRTTEVTRRFAAERAGQHPIVPCYSLEEFVASLARPRRVMLMVKAGPAVDAVLEGLWPLLEPGDVVIDGGNSHFADTDRRAQRAAAAGFRYLGSGVSGGEMGALQGPSLMPGGDRQGYEAVEPIFLRAAAQTEDGPCCTYVGAGSAGHFVKMVHNGIEYGVMQVLAECYDLMRRGLGLPLPEVQSTFARWNEGELRGYLVEITAEVLRWEDPETGRPLVDVILDRAEQKGTGKWTSQAALDLGVAVPTITAAVDARILSSLKAQRQEAARRLAALAPAAGERDRRLVDDLFGAAYVATVAAYAQGMALLATASAEKGYGLRLDEVARIWKGGCIIRSALLDPIRQALAATPELPNLLLAESLARPLRERVPALRRVVAAATAWGIPVPGLASALAYVDAYRSERLPADLIQAQRDYFGAHGYERVDRPGTFHTDWHRGEAGL